MPTTVDFSMSFPPFRKSYYYKDSLYFNNVGLKNEVLNLSDTTCRSVYSWDFGEKNYTLKQMQDLVEYDLSFRGKTPTKESQLQRFKERHENPKFPAYYSYGGFETDKFRATTLVSGWPHKFINVKSPLTKFTFTALPQKEDVFINSIFDVSVSANPAMP